jgi:hypothetical protein
MTCCYPNCHRDARYTPYVEVPTLRSVGMTQEMVKTDRPTVLLCAEVCERHRNGYSLRDWISTGDWDAIRDLAHQKGYTIPDIMLIEVHFGPVGYTPRGLELSHG